MLEAEVARPWVTARHELDKFKARMSAQRNLESLEKLCLLKITEKIEFYCISAKDSLEILIPFLTSHFPKLQEEQARGNFCDVRHSQDLDVFCQVIQDPFGGLPPVLMTALHQLLHEQGKAMNPRVLPCLVSGNTEKLNVKLCGPQPEWTKRDLKTLFQRMQVKGQNITELEMIFSFTEKSLNPNIHQLWDFLRHFGQQLRVLNLSSSYADDSLLAVLGSSCPELRKLRIINYDISDAGIDYLCNSVWPFGKCKNITHLDILPFKEDKITIDGILTALINLPELVLISGHKTIQAVFSFAVKHRNRQLLNMKHLCIDDSKLSSELLVSLTTIVQTVPNIRTLDITDSNLKNKVLNIDNILEFKSVTELNYNSSSTCICSPSKLLLIIYKFSTQLTKLTIYLYNHPIDISIIGSQCINLIHFELDSMVISDNFKCDLKPFVHFSKLQKIVLQYNTSERGFNFPDFAIKCILVSANLNLLNVIYFTISDEVIEWLTKQYKVNENILSNLQILQLTPNKENAPPSQVQQILKIIHMAPKLRNVTVNKPIGPLVEEYMYKNGLKHCKINKL